MTCSKPYVCSSETLLFLASALYKNLVSTFSSLYHGMVEEKGGKLIVVSPEVSTHIPDLIDYVPDLWFETLRLWLLDWSFIVMFLFFALASFGRCDRSRRTSF